tara:strand:- start:121 stop:693 length:573 start_codon:yes stop_codon:yes gene_type:complete
MKQILKYLIFITVGIILYLLYNIYDTFSIGGQVWGIPVGDENMALGDINLGNSIQLSVPPRINNNQERFHTYADINRVYRFNDGYYFITNIDPAYGLTRELEDAIENERVNQLGPQMQEQLPETIRLRHAYLSNRRRSNDEIQDNRRRMNEIILEANLILRNNIQTQRQADTARQRRIGRFTCSAINEKV